MGRDCQSQGFWSLGFESQSWKSRDCPNDFCPSPKSPRDFCPMGRLWDSQNSWDCLGLESQGKSRDFGIFYKNMIYSSHFAKIDLQNWNFHELQRSHVTIFADSFSTNRLNRYAEIGHLEFRRSNVKWVHLRSNLRFRLKNGIPVPLPIPESNC